MSLSFFEGCDMLLKESIWTRKLNTSHLQYWNRAVGLGISDDIADVALGGRTPFVVFSVRRSTIPLENHE